MNLAADEFRLLFAILLNAAVFAAALRFARTFSENFLEAIIDAFLIYYAVQYVVIGALGVLGLLTPVGIALGAILISMVLGWTAKPQALLRAKTRTQNVVAIGAVFFLVGFSLALCHAERFLPVMGTDALTYHFPAAVHWLQVKRVAIFETWFFNPANTYSPLAGSMFIAWLIAPFGNDVFARFVELGPLLMIALMTMSLARRLGASLALAAIIGAAAGLSRPFISQLTIIAKDDLFVVAFALAAILSISNSKFSPWRAGMALGLLLATKYTAIYTLPMLLLVCDAPRRAGWRIWQWLIAIGIAILLAGPWYLRNLLLTGNPIYPIRFAGLPGLFAIARSRSLSDAAGLYETLIGGYFSPGLALVIIWIVAWGASIVINRKRFLSDPLVRITIIGPPLLMAIFFAFAPYAEVRFIYPALPLLFGCVVLAARKFPLIVALAVLIVAVITNGRDPVTKVEFCCIGILAGGVMSALFWGGRRIPTRAWMIGGCVSAAAVGMLVFVLWAAYVKSLVEAAGYSWAPTYGSITDDWMYVAQNIPADATIAYTNTHFVHPLNGLESSRRVVYVPTRHGVKRMSDLPATEQKLSGEQITSAMVIQTFADPDREQWLAGLRDAKAQFLFIGLQNSDHPGPPPELGFADAAPAHFQRVFADKQNAAVVYRILP